MVDVTVNKYLETQLEISKQKKKKSKNATERSISEKSKVAAEIISKKQNKQIRIKRREDTGILQSFHTSISPTKPGDEDEDNLSPCDEENIYFPAAAPSTSRLRKNVKKIVDDGCKKLYNERIINWRNSLKTALSGTYDEVYYSADIQYVLDGVKVPEENHELKNGLCIPNYIWKRLYTYQKTGIKWLWKLHQEKSGGLLGDEMGLGKTVQIIAFLAGLSKSDRGTCGGLGPTIILAPATVIYQWVSHFHHWCPNLRVAVLHHSGSHGGNPQKLIRKLHSSHGILLITYAGIVKYKKDLLTKKWHYIILDEGHKIRNPDTQVSKLVKKFDTPHKLLITGSPMQNSLQELWSLFDFMRPGLLGTYNAFMDHFATPITQGGYANATEYQEATALEIAKALKNIITPYILRRTKSEVQDHIKLPEKNEQVLFCALTKEQRDLYMGYLMGKTVRSILYKDSKGGDPLRGRVLVALTTLRKICNHPDLYLHEANDDEIGEESFGNWKKSGKMSVVHSLLKIWLKQGHRTLIFSQSRAMISVFEQHLQKYKFKYLKMDGSVNVAQRQHLIKTFNENANYLVFLATTRVGGLGVNLTGADRVIIYDPDWNPATDNQAKERAWRIGQQRNVTVYRLLCAGTIEEKMYRRQIFKNFLSNKILVDANQKNVLTTSSLQNLFNLEDFNYEGDTETTALFKHTKVSLPSRPSHEKIKDKTLKNISTSKQKLEPMRRKAKEISRKITNEATISTVDQNNPREMCEKKNKALNPSKIKELEINISDSQVTNTPNENILTKLEIITKHAKKYLNHEMDFGKNPQIKELDADAPNIDGFENKTAGTSKHSKLQKNDVKHKKICKRRRSFSELEIENLIKVKKVKDKNEKGDVKLTGDDYVLSKLFAKSAVKNALQHDGIGLAEKEKRHKIRIEAIKIAKKAVEAIQMSTK